jgi:NitT/TauT family transport system substrate-binding protein
MHSAGEIASLIVPDFKEVPVATIEAVIAEYKKVKIWASDPLLRPEGMDQMMDLMVDGGILEHRFPAFESLLSCAAERRRSTG